MAYSKIKVILLSSFSLGILAFSFFVAYVSSRNKLVASCSLIIGLIAYLIAVRSIRFFKDFTPNRAIKAITFVIILMNSIILSIIVASFFYFELVITNTI